MLTTSANQEHKYRSQILKSGLQGTSGEVRTWAHGSLAYRPDSSPEKGIKQKTYSSVVSDDLICNARSWDIIFGSWIPFHIWANVVNEKIKKRKQAKKAVVKYMKTLEYKEYS